MREHGALSVAAIHVAIGEMAGVEPELFRLAFEEMVEESGARGGEMRSRVVALKVECESCGHVFRPERFRFECAVCGGLRTKVLEGDVLILERLELEIPD